MQLNKETKPNQYVITSKCYLATEYHVVRDFTLAVEHVITDVKFHSQIR